MGNDQTSTVGASEGGTSLGDIVRGLGSSAAGGAVDTVSSSLPDLSSSAGAGFASGALGQLSDAISPYLPYIVLGVAVLFLMRR